MPLSPAPESLSATLHRVAIRLLRRIRVEDEGSGLSPSRLSALSVVVFGGPLRLGELAEAEQVQPSTMSVLVRSLEEDGLAKRSPDPEDGRSVLVAASPRGRELLLEARDRRLARLDTLLEPLEEDERRTVERAAGILHRLLAGDRGPDPAGGA